MVAPSLADDRLRPTDLPARIPPLPDDSATVRAYARRPLRPAALGVVVGSEGGAGRTTTIRLLAKSFRRVRGQAPTLVDAVPMWGGLTAHADQSVDYSPADLAAVPWIPEQGAVAHMFTTIDGVPLLAGPMPVRGVVSDPATLLAAVERTTAFASLTLVDTVADVAGAPARNLIWHPTSCVVWVASATRAGLWGVAEALTYYRALGAEQIARRSIVVAVGASRRWPADAAAAETQLAGLGLETVRVPHSDNPMTDARCGSSAERLLAALVLRQG